MWRMSLKFLAKGHAWLSKCTLKSPTIKSDGCVSRTVSRKLENSVRKVFGVAEILPDDVYGD